MSLRTRLRRREQNAIEVGCPACHDRRGQIVFLTAWRLPDGTFASEEQAPQSCTRCGQVPEQVIEAVETVVGERKE